MRSLFSPGLLPIFLDKKRIPIPILLVSSPQSLPTNPHSQISNPHHQTQTPISHSLSLSPMAAAMTTPMAMLNPKCLTPPKLTPTNKPISLLSLTNLPKGLTFTSKSHTSPLTSAAIAGAVFSALSSTDAAFAAQQLADIAEGSDNRGLALLLPLIPAVLWVLYNILQPALNQLNRMRSEKGVVIGLGLGGGLAAAGFLSTPSASAAEAAGDSRGLLLLFVIAPAVGWVLYNILQPALNQINRMRSG